MDTSFSDVFGPPFQVHLHFEYLAWKNERHAVVLWDITLSVIQKKGKHVHNDGTHSVFF